MTTRERRAAAHAWGFCAECTGRPALAGSTKCAVCRDRLRRYNHSAAGRERGRRYWNGAAGISRKADRELQRIGAA